MKHLALFPALPALDAEPVATVTNTPGLVAFWDFVKREPDGPKRFTAHVPAGAKTDYPLDAAWLHRVAWNPASYPLTLMNRHRQFLTKTAHLITWLVS
jgi:hypothetical protein